MAADFRKLTEALGAGESLETLVRAKRDEISRTLASGEAYELTTSSGLTYRIRRSEPASAAIPSTPLVIRSK